MSMSITTPWLSSLRSRLSAHDEGRQSITFQPRSLAKILPEVGREKRPTQAPSPKLPVATIFHEPWWLDTASDGTYQEATVSANGAVIARLPYMVSKKLGWQTALVMPCMTHVLGPSVAPDLAGSHLTRSLKTFSICGELIAQLPKASHIWFDCHRHVTDTLAFEAAGFTTGMRSTIEIAPAPAEILWKQMRDKTRNVIRRSREKLTVTESDDPDLFLDFYEGNLKRKGLSNNYDSRICHNLVAECLRRGAGRILVATDASGVLQSGIFTVWDHDTEYYLMSTRAPESGNGATSLLIWEAIQHAAAAGLTFDMDGVNSKTNLMLLTGFGGTLKPRYFVQRTSAAFMAGQYLKTSLASLRRGRKP